MSQKSRRAKIGGVCQPKEIPAKAGIALACVGNLLVWQENGAMRSEVSPARQ